MGWENGEERLSKVARLAWTCGCDRRGVMKYIEVESLLQPARSVRATSS